MSQAPTPGLPWADELLTGVLGVIARTGFRPPVAQLLAKRSEAIAASILRREADRARALAKAAAAGDDSARLALGRLAEDALAGLRHDLGRAVPILVALDRQWHDPSLAEWLDDPAFDRQRRVRALANLDAFNLLAGGHGSVHRALTPLLVGGTAELPRRLLDLAAGHAGFTLEIARRAKAAGIAVQVTATDLKQEYLDLARPAVRSEELTVELRVQDALDLSNLADRSFDVVVCTQSLHHFPPAMVARLVAEASRVASRAVVLFDLCRSALASLFLSVVGTLRFRDAVLVRDGIASYRRAYTPAELGLLARLGAPDADARITFEPPAHAQVVLRVD